MKYTPILLALVFLVSGCVGQTTEISEDLTDADLGQHETSLPMPVQGSEDIEEMIIGNTVEIDIIAKQWEFIPHTVEVNQGDTVILNIDSVDVRHGIFISQFKVSENLNPGEITTVEFVANKKGTFPFACSVFCGSGHGHMTGEIIVS